MNGGGHRNTQRKSPPDPTVPERDPKMGMKDERRVFYLMKRHDQLISITLNHNSNCICDSNGS